MNNLPPSLPPDLWLDLLGKQYTYRGRGPLLYDCYGLVMEVCRRRGFEIGDPVYEDTDAARTDTIINSLTDWKPVPIRPGAVLLFGHNNMPTHCGVAIDRERFLHCSETYKTTLVSKLSQGIPPFRRLLLGIYDHVSAT